MKYLIFVICFSLSSICLEAKGGKEIKSLAIKDLAFIKHAIESKYAPLDWKKNLLNFDLEREYFLAKQKLLCKEEIDIKSFQEELSCFLRELADYHVGIVFYSTEKSYLPFSIKTSSDGRFFISFVSSEGRGFLKVGDEILSIDGVPIAEVIKSLERGLGTTTDKYEAIRKFVFRTAALGDTIPRGSFNLRFNRDDIERECIIYWTHLPEKIKDLSKIPHQNSAHIGGTHTRRSVSSERSSYLKEMPFSRMQPYFWSVFKEHYSSVFKKSEDPDSLASKKGFLPFLGEPSWMVDEENEFFAYTFPLTMKNGEVKNIGFLRIHSYPDFSSCLAENFKEIISKLERETDALIIDQQNNPGGYLLSLYAMVSYLVDKPVKIPLHRIALTQEEAFMCNDWLEQIEEVSEQELLNELLGEYDLFDLFDMDFLKNLKKFSKDVIKDWEEGRHLSSPLPIFGLDTILPQRNGYTKPILLLINEACFSCADFFPAIMKDSKRALLVGKTTAGAGGFVYEVSFPNKTGIKFFSLTGSLAQRTDQSIIENFGVSPDIILDINNEDLIDNYSCYKRSVLRLLEDRLLNK